VAQKKGIHLQLQGNVARSKIDSFEHFKTQKNRSVSVVLLVFGGFKNKKNYQVMGHCRCK